MPKNKTTNNLDNLSFNQAFSQSRNALGAGKVFKWKGRRFTTNYKEEENRAKTVQDEVVKASNEKSEIESPDQRQKVNTALDLQEQIVNTDDKTSSITRSNDITTQVKDAQDDPQTSFFKGQEGLIPDEVENFFKKTTGIGQDLINKAGELINFDNDLISQTVESGKKGYNKAKNILTEVADDLHDVADDTIEAQKIRARNIKNKVTDLTETVQESAESELNKFKNKLNDGFLNETLLPFIQKNIPWGDVDENTRKVIEDPNSTTETLTDNDKTNLYDIFTNKVLPQVTKMSDDVQNYVGDMVENVKDKIPNSSREFLNDDLYPFVRDKMFRGLPRPIRQMLVQRANVSNEGMTDDEKLGLYMAYKEAVKRGDNMVKYKDYGSDRDLWEQFQGGEESIIDAGKHYFASSDVDKGAYNMMMTIGGEHFREEDGNVIFDQGYYDFNKPGGPYDPDKELSSYGKLRNYMSEVGVTEDDPNRANINISLNQQEMEDQLAQHNQSKAQAHDNAPFIYQNIPQNIIPLLTKGRQFMGMRNGGPRRKFPTKNI